MGVIIEQALFKDVNHALNFAYKMEHVSVYPSMNLNNRLRFNSWTDLSQLDRHAQAVFIRDIVESRLKTPEVAAIMARHGHGLTQHRGIAGICEHVQGVVKNSGECLEMIIMNIYEHGDAIRRISDEYNVSVRSIQDDMLSIKGCINTLEKMAYNTLENEFRKHEGLIE